VVTIPGYRTNKPSSKENPWQIKVQIVAWRQKRLQRLGSIGRPAKTRKRREAARKAAETRRARQDNPTSSLVRRNNSGWGFLLNGYYSAPTKKSELTSDTDDRIT
jgi:hypothetical protein